MTDDDTQRGPWLTVSRRRFLAGTAVLGATTLLVEDAAGVAAYLSLGRRTMTRTIRRREDQLSLKFDFYNLVRDTRAGSPPQFIRKFPGLDTFVVVTFPPQSVAEQTVADEAATAPTPVGAVLSGPTRLVFVVPAGITKIPFTLAGLLDWFGWSHSVTQAATGDPEGQPHFPKPSETAIEIPWRLILSPMKEPGRFGDTQPPEPSWAHSAKAVTHQGRTELWHTRLASTVRLPVLGNPNGKPIQTEVDAGPVRAIWAVDTSAGPLNPFTDSPPLTGPAMEAQDRLDLVDNMAVAPVDVKRLMLTPLGGYFEGGGSWPGESLIEWRHRATLGRDHYVKVVNAGYLFPFGHPAAYFTLSERKFSVAGGRKTAFLRKREFIVIRQRTKEFPGALSVADGRKFPFRSITIELETTPDLDHAMNALNPGLVRVLPTAPDADTMLRFPCVGIDQDGRTVNFTTPLVWLPKDYAFDLGLFAGGVLFPPAERARPLNGQRLSLVPSTPPTSTSPGAPNSEDGRDTSLVTDSFTLGWVEVPGSEALDQPSFGPILESAAVHVPAVAATTGSNAQTTVTWAEDYINHGLPDTAAMRAGSITGAIDNAGEVYAKVLPPGSGGPGLPVHLPAEVAGGVAAPSFAAEGLSRAHGAVADLGNVAKQTFNPAAYFPKDPIGMVQAKILGTLPLADILAFVDPLVDPVAGAVDRLPNLNTTLIYPGGDKHKPPEGSLTILDFTPKAQPDPLHIFEPTDEKTRIKLHIEIRTDFRDPSRSTYKITGLITDFTLQLIGVSLPAINIPVQRMEFKSGTGAKDDLTLAIGKVEFKGVMSFVDDFSKFMSFGGKSGPYVDVTPTGIKAGMHLMLPSIGGGLFQISNVAFSAAIDLPFAARMRLDMSFSSRKEPFLVTVYGIGGGGWVTLGMGLDGFETFEIGLEFGASVSLDLGVASGEVHVFIGIYFKLAPIDAERTDSAGKPLSPVVTDQVMQTSIEAYLRIGGSVEVLGLVTLSIELYIGFTYVLPNRSGTGNVLTGRATLVMEVSVLMFSETVSVSVERSIKGPTIIDNTLARQVQSTDDDRTFGRQVSSSDWTTYCRAFAVGA